MASYTAAIATYDAALEGAPNDARLFQQQGEVALASRGRSRSGFQELTHPAALASYAAAIAAYDAALEGAPNNPGYFNNKGIAGEPGRGRADSGSGIEGRGPAMPPRSPPTMPP
ncbi:MAG: hypothetical protein R2848_00830 [Thermomicrobiales bacterium]